MRKILTVMMGGSLALAGCSGGGEDGATGGAGATLDSSLTINLGGKPESLDPNKVSGVPEMKTLSALFDPLVRLDKDCKPIPAAAESWEPNEEYTEWTFILRPDGVWHNGDPVTAHDFEYSVERLLTPETASKYANIVWAVLEGGKEFYDGGGLAAGLDLKSVEAVDDRTIKYTMAHPTPYFDTFSSLFTFFPLHQATVEADQDRWTLSEESYIGNGPFRMKEWRMGDRIVAEKFAGHHQAPQIFWDEVEFLMIEDANTENAAFVTGDIDITESVAIPEMGYWRDRPEYTVRSLLATYFVTFNTTAPPFDDVKVRRAFRKVIDRQLLTERVTQRNEPLSRGVVPADMPVFGGRLYGDVAGDMIGDRDIEEAKQLLAESKYADGLPQIEYMYNNSDEHKKIGEQLQNMWQTALGADVRLQNVEWGVFLERASKGQFQICRSAWIGDYLDPMTFLELYTTGNPKNGPQWSNEEYDRLIDGARKETDPERRLDMLIEAERLATEEHVITAPIFSYVSPMLVQADIEGFERNILGHLLWFDARRK